MKKIRILEELTGSELHLCEDSYEDGNPRKRILFARKVIDISDFCPTVEVQALVTYASVTIGSLVLLTDCYKKGKRYVHYLYEKQGKYMEEDELARASEFVRFAKEWGISPTELAHIIFQNAP